jgi:signal transduction histidine kinase
MKKHLFRQLTIRQLRLILVIFFLALLIPTSFLVYQTYDQIKWEAYHQQRQLAEELANRIDSQFINLIIREEERTFADYSFLNVAGDPSANFLQRSPLSQLKSELAGIIGYFQIDNEGRFSTPLLPATDENISVYGISGKEYAERMEKQNRVLDILSRNQLVKPDRTARLISKDKSDEKFNVGGSRATASKPDDVPAAETVAPAPEPQLEAGLAEADSASNTSLPAPVAEEEVAEKIFGREDSQSGFDELARKRAPASQPREAEPAYSLGKVEDLNLEQQYAQSPRTKQEEAKQSKIKIAPKKQTSKRKEKSALPEQRLLPSTGFFGDTSTRQETTDSRIEIFESELDPFKFSLLNSGQFVLYRKAWRNDHRYIQGFLVESRTFVQDIINPVFQAATLARTSDLSVAYNGDVLSVLSSYRRSRYLSSTAQVEGELLYRTRLSSPFNDVELIFSSHELPVGPGGKVITWTAIVLFIVLCTGFILMYRMAAKQLSLARQQQDFVSAVSHELKTPLTSIRMYGEMLREGWADEEKKKSYYDYIYYESERLSRLIQNVLQLARMTRNDMSIELSAITISELFDTIRSKVTSLTERNNFQLNLDCDETLSDKKIEIDTDYFSQIIINLVDNAIKFSADAETRQIDIRCSAQGNNKISFSIRDYGPGIEKGQLKKIFALFYRTENELTRKTVGTGIGLALVHQLTRAMNGDIDAINQDPGVEFVITFPVVV